MFVVPGLNVCGAPAMAIHLRDLGMAWWQSTDGTWAIAGRPARQPGTNVRKAEELTCFMVEDTSFEEDKQRSLKQHPADF